MASNALRDAAERVADELRDDAGGAAGDVKAAEPAGFYDHGKVNAYVNCCVDLAKANDLGLFELLVASRNLLLACESQLARRAQELVERTAESPDGVAEAPVE